MDGAGYKLFQTRNVGNLLSFDKGFLFYHKSLGMSYNILGGIVKLKYVSNTHFVIYINKDMIDVDINKKEEIESFIKDLVIDIKRIFGYKIRGMLDVNVYHNIKYGMVIEFIKLDSLDFFPDLIDLKLHIYKNALMFLEFDDYFVIKKYKKIYYKDNKFYIDINDFTKYDLTMLSEFYNIIYNVSFDDYKILVI